MKKSRKMKQRNQTIRKKVFKRDNFTCQKCKIEDESAKILELHHITSLALKGRDEIANMITLCSDCHYVKEECDGTMTTLIKAWNKVRKGHLELFE